jgi:DNA-binding transcriptional MocR family regulator
MPTATAADQKVYQGVVDRIRAMIDAGSLRHGDRVPSVRLMAKQLGVAVGTVVHAYHVLEDAGVLVARPQSGYYVRQTTAPLPEPKPSAPPARPCTPTVGSMVVRMLSLSTDPTLVPLGGAIPSPEVLPIQKLNRITAAVNRRSSRGFAHYDLPPGCRELRVQIARHYAEASIALSPDDLIMTCGGTEAIHLCLRAVAKPGGVIAVESPVYYGHLQTIEQLGLKALEIPTDPRTGVSLPALRDALNRKQIAACLFVTNCHNPLGFTMPDTNKRQLVRLLAEHDVPLIEDDVYGDITFDTVRPGLCRSFDNDGRVLLCSSFSKTLAPGARVGWCAPGRYFERVRELKLTTTIATPTLMQLALADFAASGDYARHLRKLARFSAEQVSTFSRLIEQSFPSGTRLSRPAGGYVLWVEMPRAVDSIVLFQQAVAMKINVAPGPLFSSTGRFRNCLRISCAAVRTDRTDWAIQALGELAKKQLG